MERRAWFNDRRSVRIYLFILTIISLSLIASLVHSQPAHAEGFLGKTVRCVVGGLLGADCRTPATQQPVATPPAAESQPANQNSDSNNSTTGQAQITPARQANTATSSQITPIANIDLPATPELPTLPLINHRNPAQAEFTNFAMTNSNVYAPGGETLGVSTSAFESSRDGWRIMGAPWYLWGIGLAGIFAAGLLIKKKYNA